MKTTVHNASLLYMMGNIKEMKAQNLFHTGPRHSKDRHIQTLCSDIYEAKHLRSSSKHKKYIRKNIYMYT